MSGSHVVVVVVVVIGKGVAGFLCGLIRHRDARFAHVQIIFFRS